MDEIMFLIDSEIHWDPKGATKTVANYLFTSIYPLVLKIRNKLQSYSGDLFEEEISKIHDVFTLCTSQINKSLQTLFEIFKTEHRNGVSLQESRQCTVERLSWCVNRLVRIDHKLDLKTGEKPDGNDSMLVAPMYFVNWIDHTFEILPKLAEIIYKTDYKKTKVLYEQWKCDIVECASTLHISLDELLLSAMTLCKYCLPADQHIVKARCQVVLREFKALLSELIDGDFDSAFKVTTASLKLPIMPSNVNVLIDVLKDVLYALEANTNTALLSLVVYCFSNNQSPIDVLLKHFKNTQGTCSCLVKSGDDITEDCSFVKEFDLYNERLLQIGSFAVSCSSDQHRILTLKSGLASLEALDPHLVPAVMLSPDSHHANLLVNSWCQEVEEIRDSIFLIVDPAAFAEKSKQIMHHTLLTIMKESSYDNQAVCSVINIGCVLFDFFSVYNKFEPDALQEREKLQPLLADLHKVLIECKIVSNLLCSGDDFVYEDKKCKNNTEVTIDQLIKRLKLLHTLLNRINVLLHPKENEDLFDEVEEEPVTHTVHKNIGTYVRSPRKAANISRSIFARTSNIRSSTNKIPLQKIASHLKAKQRNELSFSVQLDELFNLSNEKDNDCPEKLFVNKQFDTAREPSVLYNFSPRKRASLRKAVLHKHFKLPFDSEEVAHKDVEIRKNFDRSLKRSLIDEATSLQITDILNEMSDITNAFGKKRESNNITYTHPKQPNHAPKSNILRINVNSNTTISKHIWNIPVNASSVEMPLDDSHGTMSSNVTQPSNVTTLERISDIDLVESRLNSLKTLELETSL